MKCAWGPLRTWWTVNLDSPLYSHAFDGLIVNIRKREAEYNNPQERVCEVKYQLIWIFLSCLDPRLHQMWVKSVTKCVLYQKPFCSVRIQNTMASPVTLWWMSGTWRLASSSASQWPSLSEEHLSTIYQITGEFSVLHLFTSAVQDEMTVAKIFW